MSKLDTSKTLFLTKLDGTKIAYSEKISGPILKQQYGENALVELIFRGNPSLAGGNLQDWNINQSKFVREVRNPVQNRDGTKVAFTSFKVDLTKPIKVIKKTQNKIIDNDEMINSEVIFQENAAKAQKRNRADVAQDIVTEALTEAAAAKLYTTSTISAPTAQPATATTTSATLTALKNNQKVTGELTDFFTAPSSANEDYNAFKLVWEAAKQLLKLGTKKSKESFYPFAENGFTKNQISIVASTDALEVIRATPGFKTIAMKSELPAGKNEYFTQVGSINGIKILASDQLPSKVEVMVLTDRALLVAEQAIPNTPFAKIIEGDGAHREIDGTVKATPQSTRLLMTEGKFVSGIAFPNEIIFIKAAS